jgi:hypothetical protein
MNIKINVFYPELKQLIGNRDSIMVTGSTVGECLNDLLQQYPGAARLLFDSPGKLLKQVYVYVNSESMYKADFSRPLTEKDELILAVLITGG